jgi:hypothetical protein
MGVLTPKRYEDKVPETEELAAGYPWWVAGHQSRWL